MPYHKETGGRELESAGLAGCIFILLAASPALAAPARVAAFIFGSRALDCATPAAPVVPYTVVLQGTPDDLQYAAGRGWGYEVVDPGNAARGGFARFGPFDSSANGRNEFPDTCPEEIYDSFIGAKNFTAACTAAPAPATGPCDPPEGIVFRIDVPNGSYRFVAAVGSADNEHASRIIAEDGGRGPPAAMSPRRVVLVANHDQAEHGPGVFARVGFDDHLPPAAAVNGFVDEDENGLETGAGASSPVLEVTSGYVRIHQLKGSTTGADGNGGDLVLLELWRVENTFEAIGSGSRWKIRPGSSEASSPDATAWREIGFDDSTWLDGAATIGYGEAGIVTDLATLLDPPMRSNFTSLFLRQRFELSRPDGVNQLVARVDYDDGFVMWINAVEVLRVNVPGLEGEFVPHDRLASSGHESGVIEEFPLPPPAGYLVAGTNVVAVEMFNVSITSSDLILDARIFDPVAPDLTPPAVAGVVPLPGSTVRSLTQVEVSFDEEVTGVDAADLLVDGVPAASLTGAASGPWVFGFPAPPVGAVSVEWAPGHGIADLADFPNPFAGGSWSYTLDPDAPAGSLAIDEILAANRSGITDEDGDTSDWIELVNDGAGPTDTAGWALSDDPEEPGKFVLPARALAPGEFLIVFLSGKDRAPRSGEIHASFKLNSSGEYLGLFNAESPRAVVSELAPRYPRQRADLAWGRTATGEFAYLSTPTPGQPNATGSAFAGFVLEPDVIPGRGFFDAPVDVTLSSRTPGATIRYTLDGSEPTTTRGTIYSAAVRVAPGGGKGTVAVRAIAYAADLLPSDVATHSYVFPASVVRQSNRPAGFPSTWNGQGADYEMDPDVVDDPGHSALVLGGLTEIPTLSIVTDVANLFDARTGIYANPSREGISWERPVSAELLYPDGRAGFQIGCGLRVQGGSSTSGWKSMKVSLRILFKGDYGPTKLRFPLFPDSAVDTFDTIVLDAHLNQTWTHPSGGQRALAQYCRDQYVSDLQNATGGYAPHDIFAHLYLNGLYWGVYDLHERPDASYAAEYFGGSDTEYDCLRHSSGLVVDGNASAYNAMLGLARRDLSAPANYAALQETLDVENLIDYMIVNLWAGNTDWAHHNWYATRRRLPGQPWRYHSWDAEHVLKSVSENKTGVNNSGAPTELYTRLRANEEFRLLFADHVRRHFGPGGVFWVDPTGSAWDPETPGRNVPASLYMRRIEEIDSFQRRLESGDDSVGSPISCESARWGDTRRSAPYTRNGEWLTELNRLLTAYFPQRSGIVLGQLRSAGLYPSVGAPLFSRPAGRIVPGTTVAISRPAGTNGTIWYTTDGSDPRVPGAGGVSPTAASYRSALRLSDHTILRARIRSGTTWSALSEATYSLADPADSLRITELMYNPPEGSAYEFLELQNTGEATVGLDRTFFVDGVQYVFPDHTTLAPGEFLLLVADAAAFASRHPGVVSDGVYQGSLANAGEEIRMIDLEGRVILALEYDDEGGWPVAPDGLGRSLVPLDPRGDLADPARWRASRDIGGSPGAEDPPGPPAGVVINEVLAGATPPFEDAIELLNLEAAPVDVSGWALSNRADSPAALLGYRLPAGSRIPAGGYRVVYESELDASPGSFSLDPAGGRVFLAGVRGGELTGYAVSAEYGPQEAGVSSGRFLTSRGVAFGALTEPTFGVAAPATVEEFRAGAGAENPDPLFGPVVIHEVMYHPAGGREEFIELYNPTASAVPLFDDGLGRGWRLRGVLDLLEAESFELAPGAAIPAGGYLVLSGIDPAVFRQLHNVAPDVPVEGAFGGGLDNGGERLELLRPLPAPDGGSEPVWARVDTVRYDDAAPWPASADGGGSSLERLDAAAYGDDPLAWAASTRLGGTPGAPNSAGGTGENRPPHAAFALAPSSGKAPLDVHFDASGSYDLDGAVVAWQWDFGDGESGDGETLDHRYATAGAWTATLTVTDDDGASASTSRSVLVNADEGGLQIAGDCNQDGALDISDAICLLTRLFLSPDGLPCEAASLQSPGNRGLLDVNDDGGVDITDAIYSLTFLFQGGPPPKQGVSCRPIAACPDGPCGG